MANYIRDYGLPHKSKNGNDVSLHRTFLFATLKILSHRMETKVFSDGNFLIVLWKRKSVHWKEWRRRKKGASSDLNLAEKHSHTDLYADIQFVVRTRICVRDQLLLNMDSTHGHSNFLLETSRDKQRLGLTYMCQNNQLSSPLCLTCEFEN